MALALDEPKESDKKFEFGQVTVVVDNELLDQTGGISMDFVTSGFRAGLSITPKIPLRSERGQFSCDGCGEE